MSCRFQEVLLWISHLPSDAEGGRLAMERSHTDAGVPNKREAPASERLCLLLPPRISSKHPYGKRHGLGVGEGIASFNMYRPPGSFLPATLGCLCPQLKMPPSPKALLSLPSKPQARG